MQRNVDNLPCDHIVIQVIPAEAFAAATMRAAKMVPATVKMVSRVTLNANAFRHRQVSFVGKNNKKILLC